MHLRKQKSHPPACISKLGTLVALIVVNASFRASLAHGAKEQPEDMGMPVGLKSEFEESPSVTGSPVGKLHSDGSDHADINEYDQEQIPGLNPCAVKFLNPPKSPCLTSSSSGDIYYTDSSDVDSEYDPVSEDLDKRSFNAWGGKRSFNAWGGKRSSFNAWGGKRSSFNPWGGKRSVGFNPWGGKRSSSLNPSDEKRAYPSEFLRQLYSSQLTKKGFNSWGGKRQILSDLSGSSRSSKNDYPHGRRLPFNPWGGR